MNDSLPQVLVVGDQRFADILAGCGAQWQVFPAAATVAALWDAIEAGQLPASADVVIFTDGTATMPDELESSLAAFAPYSETFLVAAAALGPARVARAQELAAQMEDGDPSRPIYLLPAEDLNACLATLRTSLAGEVTWVDAAPAAAPAPAAPPVTAPVSAPAGLTPVAPPAAAPTVMPVAAPVTQMAPVAPPVAAPVALPAIAPTFTPAAMPVAPPVTAPAAAPPATAPAPEPFQDAAPIPPTASGGLGFPQGEAAVYSEAVVAQVSAGSSKRPDARPGQVTIACMSSKGGSGKSTTAISLAGMIARASAAAGDPKKVVLVDLDTRDGQVGSLINQYLPTAVNIRVMPKWDAETVTANLVHDRRLGIDALLAPIRPRNADDVGPDFYRQVIQVLQTTHDVIILDCSVNYLDPLLGVGFALADEILFVTTLATTSVQGMARALTELFADPAEGGLGIPREKVGIVANQVIHNVGMGRDKLLKAALGAPLVGQIPAEHDEVLIQTNSNRMDNLLLHPRLGRAYYKLAQACLPNWTLAPLTAEAAMQAPQPATDDSDSKKRGLFRR